MKTKLFFITLSLLLFGAISLQAQPVVKDAISVNGLTVGQKYTPAQMRQALGNPTRIQGPQVEDAYANSFTFYYGENRFYLIGDTFYGFDIYTPTYLVNGCLKIGGNILLLNDLGGVREAQKATKCKLIRWRPSVSGLYRFASLGVSYDSQNKIIILECFINDL